MLAGFLLFKFFFSAGAIEDRHIKDVAAAKANAATIAVFPEPLPAGFRFQSGITSDEIRTVRLTGSDGGYPFLDIEADPKNAKEEAQTDSVEEKTEGFSEFKRDSIPICGKMLNYRLGHGSGLGKGQDFLTGRIKNWSADHDLKINVTADAGAIDVSALKKLFASLKPLGSSTQSPLSSSKKTDAVFSAKDIADGASVVLVNPKAAGWFTAGLVAVANSRGGAQSIANTIHAGDDGKYVVIFSGDTTQYAVNEDDIKSLKRPSAIKWVNVLLCAIEQRYPNGEGVYGSAEAPKPAIQTCLETLTGKTIQSIRPEQKSVDELIVVIQKSLKNGDPILFSVKGPQEVDKPSSLLRQNAAYPIISLDRKNRTIQIPRAYLQSSDNEVPAGSADRLADLPIDALVSHGRFISFPAP